MGNRYWITGVQLGMLMTSQDNERFAKEIMENQELDVNVVKDEEVKE